MSRKPEKKSDRDRGWREGTRRSRRAQVRMTRHLIVCEGKRTEPLYFEGMRASLSEQNRGKLHIDVLGTGKHTLDLLEFAIEKARSSANSYAHVWVVYDKDDFDEREFDEVTRRCAEARVGNTQFHAIWSNPCFELWPLLHFEYTSAPMTSGECARRLDREMRRACGRSYEKAFRDLYELLAGRCPAAQLNAERLLKEHANLGHTKPSERNPATRVGAILEKIGPFLEDVT